MRYVVEVGDMKVGREGDQLVTYALGSCLGLMIYEPVAHIGGLLHAMLPSSKLNPEKAQANPFMFVDTGVAILMKALNDLGGLKTRMIVKAVGCGNRFGKNEMFKIGERNYTVLKKLLRNNNLFLKSEDVGGVRSRTIYFDISTGRTIIRTNGKKWEL
jgi:chemotaxis protein CheD